MKTTSIRAAALALALLMLIPAALTGCKSDPATSDTNETNESTSLPIDQETTAPDAFENTVLLASDGKTEYTVVVPDYAASWELTAADRLVSTFADLGATLTSAVDATAAATAKEIVVGYTNRNTELADDFYDVGVKGYHIAVMGDKLFVGANSEEGMTAALEAAKHGKVLMVTKARAEDCNTHYAWCAIQQARQVGVRH